MVTGDDPGCIGLRRRSVLLQHRLPDASTHVDWLLAVTAPSAPGDRCVWTWRLDARPDRIEPGCSVPGVRIEDHRGVYMHHEGRVSPESSVDRGTVRRLAVASAVIESLTEDALTMRIEWRDRDGAGEVVPMRLRIAAVAAQGEEGGEEGGDESRGRRATITRLDRPTAEFPRRTS